MVNFDSVMRSLEGMGLSDVLIPFILIFTVIYAVLQRSHIFGGGDQEKTYNIVVSTIMGLVVVIPHLLGRYPAGGDVVDIINSSLPNVGIVLVMIIMFFLILGVFGASPNWPNKISGFIVILAFLVVGYIFGRSAGWFGEIYNFDTYLSPDTQALLIVVGVFALIIWFVTHDSSNSKPFTKSFAEFADKIGDVVKKS